DGDLVEVSILVGRKPANRSTWVAGPGIAARYAALAARPFATYRPHDPGPADVEIRLDPPLRSPLTPILALLGHDPYILAERAAVETAARDHPRAQTFDIRYPIPLTMLRRAHARHQFFSLSGDHAGAGGRRSQTLGPPPGARQSGRAVSSVPEHRPLLP